MLWQTPHDGSTRCDALLVVPRAKRCCGGIPRHKRAPTHKLDRARARVREVKAPLRTVREFLNRRPAVPAVLGRRRRDYPTVCALRARFRPGAGLALSFPQPTT